MNRNRFGRLLIIIVVFGFGCAPDEMPEHQAEVAEKGAEVMPFDLDRTTHIFEKLDDGGRQQVISDDGDPGQIELIRAHLEEEAGRFSRGDFHDPEMIHGQAMAGLHELVMGHDRISIEYSSLESGGQIGYSTEDTALVAAIHRWFEVQVSDHGDHAQDHQ